MNTKNLMRRDDLVCDYICDKLYHIVYRDYCNDIKNARGLVIHYSCDNVDLVNSFGMFHVRYENIISMEPIAFSDLNGPQDFTNFVNEYLGEKIYECT